VTTLVVVGSSDSIEEDIASAGMAAIKHAFDEAMSKLDLITQSWRQAADEALALEPRSTTGVAVAGSTLRAA
jgi:hypothetical protein